MMRRGDYLIKRTGFALATIFVAITLNFFLFRVLPGSAITNIAPPTPSSGPASTTPPGYGLFDLVQTTLQVHKVGQ